MTTTKIPTLTGILDESSIKSPGEKARFAAEVQRKAEDAQRERMVRQGFQNRPANSDVSKAAAEDALQQAEVRKRIQALGLPANATDEDIAIAERLQDQRR